MELFYVLAEERRLEKRLARLHPIHISAKRIDFAIVGDITIRMGALPTRKSIG